MFLQAGGCVARDLLSQCSQSLHPNHSTVARFLQDFSRISLGFLLAEPAWLRDSQPRMATPLRLENFGRIDFSLGRWITRGKKTPKSMTPYVKVPGELVRIFFHSLLWPQRSLLYGFPPHCTKQSVFLTLQLDRICQNRVSYLSAMLFYRFYAALTGLLHGNHCYFDKSDPAVA